MKQEDGKKIDRILIALVTAPVFISLFLLAFTLFSLVVLTGLLICAYEDFKRSDFVAKLLSL